MDAVRSGASLTSPLAAGPQERNPMASPHPGPSPDSPLQLYLQDINETPLLTAEQERELADLVAKGDPFAREQMVKANLRLVVNIARGYLGKGLSLDDLIMEGNLGLMRAVEGFDGWLETRFSTYASYWIKQSIRRAVMNQGKQIRLPAYMVSLLAKWRRAKGVLAETLGRAPTPDEVGRALRLSKKKLEIVAQALRANSLTPRPDDPGNENQSIGNILTDDRVRPAGDVLVEADDIERVFARLDQLEPREAMVVRMRFGLDDEAPLTLREVGERLGLTRERVRQLENLALQKLSAAIEESDDGD
jgi:RNA polymerase primary sigma factor